VDTECDHQRRKARQGRGIGPWPIEQQPLPADGLVCAGALRLSFPRRSPPAGDCLHRNSRAVDHQLSRPPIQATTRQWSLSYSEPARG